MKIINKNTITCEEEKINTLSERFILEAMDHPFIVKLHYAFQSERKLYLLCDLMSGVSNLRCRANFSIF
jgi:serine/threonine protein kinase